MTAGQIKAAHQGSPIPAIEVLTVRKDQVKRLKAQAQKEFHDALEEPQDSEAQVYHEAFGNGIMYVICMLGLN